MVTSPEVSWLFFKARAKHPYLSHTGRASNTEKQPTGPGPEGCVENGPPAALPCPATSSPQAETSRRRRSFFNRARTRYGASGSQHEKQQRTSGHRVLIPGIEAAFFGAVSIGVDQERPLHSPETFRQGEFN
jgi:hypothetical protein